MFGLMEFQQPPSISDLANKLKGNRMRWTSSRMQGSRSLAEFVCYFLFFLKHHVVLLEGNDFRKICFRRPPKMFRLLSLTNYPSPGNKLRLILLAILNCKFDNFLALFGLVCSSFVTISKGSHWRYPHDPLGRPGVKFVDDGNHMTAKTLDSILA